MPLPRTDSFTAAAGVLDATWTQQHTGSVRYDGSGNATAGADTNQYVAAFDNQNVYPNDQYSKATVAGTWESGRDLGGPITRAVGGDRYEVITDLTFVRIRVWLGGSPALLSSVVQAVAVGDILELRSVGSSHSAYLNGTLVAGSTVTDTSIVSGSAGIVLFDDTGGAGGTPLISAWEGGTFTFGNAPASDDSYFPMAAPSPGPNLLYY